LKARLAQEYFAAARRPGCGAGRAAGKKVLTGITVQIRDLAPVTLFGAALAGQ
jgi:hypothetical protein